MFFRYTFEQGNGIYVSMEAVATNQGSIILKDETDTLQMCEKLCENHSGCHSFKYCKKGPQGKQCSLTDEPLTGNEPAIFEEECASYYTAGIHFLLFLGKLHHNQMLLNKLSISHLTAYIFLKIVTSPVRHDAKSQSIQTIAKRSEELTHVFAEKSWDVTQMAQNQNV